MRILTGFFACVLSSCCLSAVAQERLPHKQVNGMELSADGKHTTEVALHFDLVGPQWPVRVDGTPGLRVVLPVGPEVKVQLRGGATPFEMSLRAVRGKSDVVMLDVTVSPLSARPSEEVSADSVSRRLELQTGSAVPWQKGLIVLKTATVTDLGG